MVTIKDVEYVLSRIILPPPKHIYISEKPIKVVRQDERFSIMGFQKRGENMIVLTPYSTTENIIHETAHAFGFGEIGAQIIGKLGALRLQLFPNIIVRPIKYRLVEEDAAEKLKLEESPHGHYILREKASYQVRHFILEV